MCYSLIWQIMLDNLPMDEEKTGDKRNEVLWKDNENTMDRVRKQ